MIILLVILIGYMVYNHVIKGAELGKDRPKQPRSLETEEKPILFKEIRVIQSSH